MQTRKRLFSLILAGSLVFSSASALLAQSTEQASDQTASKSIFMPLINSGGATTAAAATTATGGVVVENTTTPQAGFVVEPIELVPDQYIVVLSENVVAAAGAVAATMAAETAASYGGEVLYTYDAAFNGFAIRLPAENVAAALATLASDERVEFVEQDGIAHIDGEVIEVVDEGDAAEAVEAAAVTPAAIQINPPWGLDRIDQHAQPLNARYDNHNFTGTGVKAFIIDTGIRTTHTQFQGRAISGFDAVDGSLPATDCHGHGTHVAGTVGGKTYGVAKSVQLVAVRVLDCNGSGSFSGVIAGVNYVTQQKRANPTTPMVANMSLGGGRNNALNLAVRNSVNAGVTYAVAAGNDNINACLTSPASEASAITVGATQRTLDARASFSNYGSCLDIFAPGVGVISAWYTSDTARATLSGTSMASPHVAGVAALHLERKPADRPAVVASALTAAATLNLVTNPGPSSPNKLLFVSTTP